MPLIFWLSLVYFVVTSLVGLIWVGKGKTLTLLFVVTPLLYTAYAMYSLWNEWLSLRDLVLFFSFYLLTGLGVTLGFHRLVTHKSFETRPAVKLVFAVLGSMAGQGRVGDWVAVHLKHHALSDQEGDPHSPLEGLFHAHVGWLFGPNQIDRARYGKRVLSDPIYRFVDRTFFLWFGLGFLIPFLIGGWSGLLWGGLVRLFVVSHVTWSVNSICHTFGDRPFDIKDESRNNFWIGLLAFGEGWHHNHHAFPAMAYHGMSWRQFDLSAIVIRLLRKLKLAWDVNMPSAELIERRRRKPVTQETPDPVVTNS